MTNLKYIYEWNHNVLVIGHLKLDWAVVPIMKRRLTDMWIWIIEIQSEVQRPQYL